MVVVLCLAIVAGWYSGNEPRLDAVAAAQQSTGIILEHAFVDVGEVTLHVVMAGPPDGRPVVLLHGFPEFWYAWRSVMPVLVAAGYRVIVPDQRGYGDSSKPPSVQDYRVDLLGNDIAQLIARLGYTSASVVGHDWGGGVAWNLAIRHPECVDRLVILDTPHPDVARLSISKEKQIDWYWTAFQLPYIPEYLSRVFHWAIPSKMLQDTSMAGTFADQKIVYYRSAWDRDGSYGKMVNWYRANPMDRRSLVAERRVKVPTLILLAPHDAFIAAGLTRASLRFLDNGRLVELAEGTHWVIQEYPSLVGNEIALFCRPMQPYAFNTHGPGCSLRE
jgi:pimeloyl-ACP methyl ester carboxylesterase